MKWDICEYKPIWSKGAVSTEALRTRILELLEVIRKRAQEDRQGGRFEIANLQDELAEAVTEWMRLMDNGINAARESNRVLSKALERST